jgi:hypothetical protein
VVHPPPLPIPRDPIIDDLNWRFKNGHITNELRSAGILIKQFDASEDQNSPWRGCPNHVALEGAGQDCYTYGGRFSSTIINADMFTGREFKLMSREAGIIFNPQVTKLNCVYGGPVGLRKLPDDGCGEKQYFCDPIREANGDSWCNGQPHEPEHLAHAMAQERGLNMEVVVNTAFIDEHLPDAVDAFFFVKSGTEASRRRVENAHAKFHEKYPFFDPFARTAHPLLCLDTSDVDRPFKTEDCKG